MFGGKSNAFYSQYSSWLTFVWMTTCTRWLHRQGMKICQATSIAVGLQGFYSMAIFHTGPHFQCTLFLQVPPLCLWTQLVSIQSILFWAAFKHLYGRRRSNTVCLFWFVDPENGAALRGVTSTPKPYTGSLQQEAASSSRTPPPWTLTFPPSLW